MPAAATEKTPAIFALSPAPTAAVRGAQAPKGDGPTFGTVLARLAEKATRDGQEKSQTSEDVEADSPEAEVAVDEAAAEPGTEAVEDAGFTTEGDLPAASASALPSHAPKIETARETDESPDATEPELAAQAVPFTGYEEFLRIPEEGVTEGVAEVRPSTGARGEPLARVAEPIAPVIAPVVRQAAEAMLQGRFVLAPSAEPERPTPVAAPEAAPVITTTQIEAAGIARGGASVPQQEPASPPATTPAIQVAQPTAQVAAQGGAAVVAPEASIQTAQPMPVSVEVKPAPAAPTTLPPSSQTSPLPMRGLDISAMARAGEAHKVPDTAAPAKGDAAPRIIPPVQGQEVAAVAEPAAAEAPAAVVSVQTRPGAASSGPIDKAVTASAQVTVPVSAPAELRASVAPVSVEGTRTSEQPVAPVAVPAAAAEPARAQTRGDAYLAMRAMSEPRADTASVRKILPDTTATPQAPAPVAAAAPTQIPASAPSAMAVTPAVPALAQATPTAIPPMESQATAAATVAPFAHPANPTQKRAESPRAAAQADGGTVIRSAPTPMAVAVPGTSPVNASAPMAGAEVTRAVTEAGLESSREPSDISTQADVERSGFDPFTPRDMAQRPTETQGRPLAGPETARQIATQIGAHLEGPDAVKAANGGFDLRLDPDELGQVRLKLVTQDNASVLYVSADRPETLDLMRRHIASLEQDLRAMGHNNLTLQFAGNGTQGQSFGQQAGLAQGWGNGSTGGGSAGGQGHAGGSADTQTQTQTRPAARLGARDSLDLRL